MTADRVAYLCFLYGCAILTIIPPLVVAMSVQQIREEKRDGNQSGSADVRRWLFIGTVLGTIMLTPLGANAFLHVWQLTPSEFVQEFASVSLHR